jgi:hypothetical protein
MERTIYFEGRIGRFDIPSFTVTENERLGLKFVGLPDSSVYRFIAAFICGEKRHIVTLDSSNRATLDYELLSGGNSLEIKLEARSAKTDKLLISSNPEEDGFFVEPLKIEHIDCALTAVGWMQRIESEIEAIRQRLGIAETEIQGFKEVGIPLPVVNNEDIEKE